jgi:NADP-dependent aldehyde dehydrogenase
MFKDATTSEISEVMQQAWNAFHIYRKMSLKQRADFMRTIAVELEACGDELIQTAMRETNLPEARMRNETRQNNFSIEFICRGM